MYDVRQFKPTLYVLLFLGMSGFAMAAESPGLWLLAAGALLLNAWLVASGRFVPLPRLLANALTLAALAVAVAQVRSADTTRIIIVGQYLVLLHLIKLFELRGNRDYAQLLVLSLLLMVAAAISTASLIFGITFIVYLFLSLYCCLLFHLKVEADKARAAYGLPEEQINPMTLRQDQRYLSRSMRRLTGAIAFMAITMAVVVFLFFPRGGGAEMFGPIQPHPNQVLSGFSDQVSFQKIAQITVSQEVVARVEVFQNGQPLSQPGALLLRGSALDSYSGSDASRYGLWTWFRSRSIREEDRQWATPEHLLVFPTDNEGAYRQTITLQPTGTHTLFAMAGLVSFSSPAAIAVRYAPRDGILESVDRLIRPLQYTVVSTGLLPMSDSPNGGGGIGWRSSVIDPQIRDFARSRAVCGVDARGTPLAEHPLAGDHSYDGQIAVNFEHYLRANYQYSLDLTSAAHIGKRDPIVAFLTDFKKGHCEYFAGAMALMCQSIHIPARVIAGFRCGAEEFNTLGNYYLVRQSDAHAWCEVFTGNHWETFDPTTDRLDPTGRRATVLARLSRFFDYLEFKWANSVVAYGQTQRDNLVEKLNTVVTRSAIASSQNVGLWPQKLDQWWEHVKLSILDGAIVVTLAALLATVIAYFVERRRLRRRARRIGLETLPTPEQLRLVRQLAFYDDLLRILQRHQIVRPDHLTPLEFCRTLNFLPNAVYDQIHRLTQLFYRVRYGGRQLHPHRQRHLAAVVHHIQLVLENSPAVLAAAGIP